jgi:hypothetical protein
VRALVAVGGKQAFLNLPNRAIKLWPVDAAYQGMEIVLHNVIP